VGWIFSVALVGWIAFAAYQRAKRAGQWSWRLFAISLGFAAAICVLVSVPIIFFGQNSRYFWPVFIAAWVIALAAIVWFAIYSKRWMRTHGLNAAKAGAASVDQSKP
jgi:carbon starvation protein CstA